jgi:hypothetical protein
MRNWAPTFQRAQNMSQTSTGNISSNVRKRPQQNSSTQPARKISTSTISPIHENSRPHKFAGVTIPRPARTLISKHQMRRIEPGPWTFPDINSNASRSGNYRNAQKCVRRAVTNNRPFQKTRKPSPGIAHNLTKRGTLLPFSRHYVYVANVSYSLSLCCEHMHNFFLQPSSSRLTK